MSLFKSKAEKREHWLFRRFQFAANAKRKARFAVWRRTWAMRVLRERIQIPRGAWTID